MNKRMFALALAAAVTMIAVPAMAQDNFPDVPENHWAYEAIENLKREGILVGYPDGTFKGPRAATRYEMAVALNAAYQRLKNITDGLAEQIAEIRANMGKGGDSGLADRLAAVEAQLRGMSSLADDMAAMKRMAGEFQKELASLGVDVEAMKKDIDAMKKMGVTEPSIKISGDANIVMHAGVGDDGAPIYGIDGRWLGWDEQRDDTTNSILGDMNIYHEIALNIDGNVTGGVKWGATIVTGNLLGGSSEFINTPGGLSGSVTPGYGNLSGRFQDTAFGEGDSDIYIPRFTVDLSDNLPFHAVVGRFGAKSANPYLFRRADSTPYFDNERWDDGGFITDGVQFGWDFGTAARLGITAGRNDQRLSVNGIELSPISLGSLGLSGGMADWYPTVQNSLLTELTFGLTDRGHVVLTYNWHGLNAFGEGTTSGDRLEVMGVGADFKVSDQLKINAGYGQSVLKYEGTELINNDNTAIWVSADYTGESFGLNLGYRNIEEDYLAPGEWERLGTWFEPRGIEDFQAGANFGFGGNAKVRLRGIFGSVQNGGPDYNSLKGDVDFGFGGGWNGTVGYERFSFESSGTDPKQSWITVGVNRALGNNGLLKLVYQYGDHSFYGVKDRGRSDLKGHILFGQVTVKF